MVYVSTRSDLPKERVWHGPPLQCKGRCDEKNRFVIRRYFDQLTKIALSSLRTGTVSVHMLFDNVNHRVIQSSGIESKMQVVQSQKGLKVERRRPCIDQMTGALDERERSTPDTVLLHIVEEALRTPENIKDLSNGRPLTNNVEILCAYFIQLNQLTSEKIVTAS